MRKGNGWWLDQRSTRDTRSDKEDGITIPYFLLCQESLPSRGRNHDLGDIRLLLTLMMIMLDSQNSVENLRFFDNECCSCWHITTLMRWTGMQKRVGKKVIKQVAWWWERKSDHPRDWKHTHDTKQNNEWSRGREKSCDLVFAPSFCSFRLTVF